MKKITTLLLALAAVLSCGTAVEVPFTRMSNYFALASAPEPSGIISSQQDLEKYFGLAPVMGRDGTPTAIDFEKEIALPVVLPETDCPTEITPISLENRNGELVLTVSVKTEESTTWRMRPFLLVKTDKGDYSSLKVVRKDI